VNVAVLGTGTVGRTLAAAIAAAGNGVAMGTRDVDALLARDGDDAFAPWAQTHPDLVVQTFADAAAGAELIFNATPGTVSLDVVDRAGMANLAGKVLVDVANPLDFSQGFPPSLTVANTDSLAEQIQRAVPDTRVVKALNTVTAAIMVAPDSIGGGDHDLPVCGNDDDAKATVVQVLRDWFGWRSVLDLGDLSAARGMEAYLLLWVRMLGAAGTPLFNTKIVR
jgi:8-hydroxy-5-deazaflavin:NADPH oxidoreductase